MARRISSLKDYRGLSPQERESRVNALRAVGLARREGLSLDWAAGQVGSSIEEIKHWASEAVGPYRHYSYYPTASDEIPRLRPVIFKGGTDFVLVKGSDAADVADSVFSVQWDFLHGRASADELGRLQGTRFGGREVEADPEALKRLAEAGDVDPPEIYGDLVG